MVAFNKEVPEPRLPLS